jgi:hypothetical protein
MIPGPWPPDSDGTFGRTLEVTLRQGYQTFHFVTDVPGRSNKFVLGVPFEIFAHNRGVQILD